jgi:cyclophilin family peptidyl-prolyl cis-trans isomerase
MAGVTRPVALTLALLGIACAGCKRETPGTLPSASSTTAATPASASPVRARELGSIEQRRDSAAVTADDVTSRDVVIRRRAARALARIADERSAKLLGETLADEDLEVVAWSAYGLGYACKGREPQSVRALAARSASLFAADTSASAGLDATEAIADALSRCGTSEGERTLRAWLDAVGARSESAALALGRLAARHKRLDDASIVSLLDVASRPEQPVSSALFAFTRLAGLPESVQARLDEVARELIKRPGASRVYAIRALGRAGTRAAPKLAEVVANPSFNPSERADAARELAKLGVEGQNALAALLEKLAPPADRPLDPKALVSAGWGPLITVLEALKPETRPAEKVLTRLAALAIPDKASPALSRRVITLRCRAAALRARTSADAALVECDPDPSGRIGRLAVVRVLDRGKITGPRYARFRPLAEAADPVVRQAAIALMPAHPEIDAPHLILAAALGAKQDGTVASAAEVLAAYPDRASLRPESERRRGPDPARNESASSPPLPHKPHESIVQAVTKAFEQARAPDAVEVRAALIDAAGALELLSLKGQIQNDCASDNPTLRQRAEKALRLLGERDRQCKQWKPPARAPAELDSPITKPTRLVFETDAGSLELSIDPEHAPVAATRIVELARAGFFEGIVAHRVVPGFVVQFGDPGGDGYGGAGRPSLRCETSPLRFESGRVGVALAGRDTGSSQIFVTLGPFPHLDGDYSLIGRAQPGWDVLAEGDVIRKVRVSP